jgi:hypothetical protein
MIEEDELAQRLRDRRHRDGRRPDIDAGADQDRADEHRDAQRDPVRRYDSGHAFGEEFRDVEAHRILRIERR